MTTTPTTSVPPTAAPAPPAPFGAGVWARRSLAAGGVLFALGNLLHPLEHTDAAYRSATWEAAHLVILASIPLLVLGLPVLHATLRERTTSLLAGVAVGATIVGLIGLAPGMVVEAFVAPTIGHDAMQALEEGAMGTVSGLFGIGYLGGSLVLAWSARRAGLRPRWAPPAIIVATLALVVCMGFTGPAVGVVIIAGTSVFGLALAALARAHGRS